MDRDRGFWFWFGCFIPNASPFRGGGIPPESISPCSSPPPPAEEKEKAWEHENEDDDDEVSSDPREARRARAGGAAAFLMQKRYHPHLAAAATASASPSSSSGGGGSGFGFCFNDIMELDAGSGGDHRAPGTPTNPRSKHSATEQRRRCKINESLVLEPHYQG